ncbi:uncharacterized protein LOC127878061 isoform X2 [Dreissena polymorpha]|uniref:uncharacterized protein LOC127878061 isoform X2 n=1 Tax=Dreissena polymorpha TaxID=45954 RepID=UPI002264016C|nr:uncharacterized protein LOC127878061 isoform X2 [Dreissena polymorpha]
MTEPEMNADLTFVLEFFKNVEEKETIPNLKAKANEAKRRLTRSLDSDRKVISEFHGENNMLKNEIKTLKEKLAKRDAGNTSEAPRFNTKLQEEKQELEKKLTSEREKVDELVKRLSAMASSKLCEDNPNIADLSDAFRPTRLAEQFREMYDNEWTDAFTVIEKSNGKEEETIELLATVIKEADKFCSDACGQQIEIMICWAVDEMKNPKFKRNSYKDPCAASQGAELDQNQSKTARRMMKELQKKLAVVSVQPLAEVQTPPVEMRWAEINSHFDKSTFTFYTKQGTKVGRSIWPAVFLTANGPLISKGIAQGKE